MKRFSAILIGSLAAGWCAVAAVAATRPQPAKRPQPSKRLQPAKSAARPAPAPARPQPAAASAGNVSPEAAEFFERHVRPVLAEHCYACHGSKIAQSGLRVDSLAGLLRGMDGGRPALVKGDPERSPLIHVVRYDGKIKMPPQGKLPDAAIEALTTWVKMGAPWPGDAGAAASTPDPKRHWAFQPPKRPAVPAVKHRGWARTPIDAFILARLEARGLRPNPPADRRTLIRRASLDLTGLPPTPEEVESFVRDRSPDAWEKVIDRLLASPRYGERWGRYWLDVARYADTKGYVFQEERRYAYAYTYRDWVIRAFNEDMPYDRFLKYQIAADQLVTPEAPEHLAAMGFLTLGRRFLNNQPDIIDDRLDTLFRGTQALTISCARCHDHKFDPIPMADYYSLYGVFASSQEPRELPLIVKPEASQAYVEFEKKLAALRGEVDAFLERKHRELLEAARAKIGVALLAARAAARPGADERQIAQQRELPPALLRRWVTFLAETAKTHHPIFAPWHQLAALPDGEFAARAPALMARFAANDDPAQPLHPRVAQLFAAPAPASLEEVAARYQQLLAAPPAEDQPLLHALDSIGGPLNIERGQVVQFLDRAARNEYQALREKADRFEATAPNAPPRAMVLVDLPQPVTPRIFRRGNPSNPGDAVPRQFLAVLSGPERKPFVRGSGRLELAEAIARRENPLTARVMVNRIWLGHFGQGLVRTPSDFGLRSDPPSHPELLDWLAVEFMEGGWSIKRLHRLIMRSSVYMQSSADQPQARRLDPENTLLWRQNRRRLDLEAMRDSLLAVSGRLDLTMGGPSVDILREPFVPRRTVYGFIDRQNLPNFFRTFDFASPDTSSPQRYQTTVPQQALYLMNSPFVVAQAKALAARPEVAGAADPAARVAVLYRLVYQRAPEPEETALALRFLAAAGAADAGPPAGGAIPTAQGGGSRLSPWEQYAQALLMSNEFMFVD